MLRAGGGRSETAGFEVSFPSRWGWGWGLGRGKALPALFLCPGPGAAPRVVPKRQDLVGGVKVFV